MRTGLFIQAMENFLAQVAFSSLDGKVVELVVEGSGEVLRYKIGKGFVR